MDVMAKAGKFCFNLEDANPQQPTERALLTVPEYGFVPSVWRRNAANLGISLGALETLERQTTVVECPPGLGKRHATNP
jgi:hypothetical protein